ncbi:MAG: mechanosensitive ion channel [Lautropia sp.]|nr:mechanosensitive ion channel [Lautropia sp.]
MRTDQIMAASRLKPPAARRSPGFYLMMASLLAMLLLSLWHGSAGAAAPAKPAAPQDTTAANTPPAAPAAPAPIAAANLVSRAERDENALTVIREALQMTPVLEQIKRQQVQQNSDVTLAKRRSRNVMATGNLRQMRDFQPVWKELHTEVSQLDKRLIGLAESIQQAQNQLGQMKKVWESTQSAIEAEETPDSIRQRIEALLASIDGARRNADQVRNTLFERQTQSSKLLANVTAEQNLLKNTLTNSLDTLFQVDSPQLYGIRAGQSQQPQTAGDAPSGMQKLLTVAESSTLYLRARLTLSLGLLALFVGLYVTLVKLSRRTDQRVQEARRMPSVRWLLGAPFSVSLLTTVAVTSLALPYAPASMHLLLLLAALVPSVMLLRQIAPPYLAPYLYWLLAMYAFNQVPDVFMPDPVLERLFFQGQMLATIVVLVFLLHRRKLALASVAAEAQADNQPVSADSDIDDTRIDAPPPDRRERALKRTGYIILAVLFGCTFALLADLAGFTRLGRFAAQATLNSLFGAMILFTCALVCNALMRLALRLWPLNQLKMMANDTPLIEARLSKLIKWTAIALWAGFALDQLMLLTPMWDRLKSMLAATLNVGQFAISLGDILRFFAILWGSLLLSRLVRYVLDQEVFTRISLPRGIPYAFSTVLNYLLLIGGVLLAVAATGISLDRFTIFASAIGVGVGFGLQSIVNNFVSGLIVLFARPIKVGDSVDLSGQSGRVQRIGIRASILRTGAGADVIVPNSQLIANQVVNWTLTDSQRRLEIAITVTYDSDPERVMTLLTDIARGHEEVLVSPAPNAQFADFVSTGMQFKLFAWAGKADRINAIRSDLCLQIHKALKRENIQLTPAK